MTHFIKKISFMAVGIGFCILAFSCSGDQVITKPELKITASNITEGDEGETAANIIISASIAPSEDVFISYSTLDESAKSASDYQNVTNGSAIIPAGKTETTIQIPVNGDKILEFNEKFKINFSDPENAVLDNNFVFVTILNDDEPIPLQHVTDGYTSPISYTSMNLTWSDEFEGPDINTNDWTFEFGDSGWGNEELQYYSDSEENAKITDGKLVITAKTGDPSHQYTSARMITKDKQEFKYGRIDIRARLPKGQGIWPALWMLGANLDEVGWPKCGEIDIMELVGHEPGKSHGTVHYDKGGWTHTGSFYSLQNGDIFEDEFHVFSIFWEENSIKWYIDYNKFYEVNKTSVGVTYPFNDSFFFIFNVAVGGLWPGYPDETTVFPQEMIVDYIRVFQPE